MRHKAIAFVVVCVLILAGKLSISAVANPPVLPWPAVSPVYDHVVIVVEENDDKRHYQGLTNPFVAPTDEFRLDLQNRIVTIFAGAHIKPGEYGEGKGITHVNVLRTLEAMYGLPRSGAQQPNAAGGGISDIFVIADVFN